MNPIQIAEKCYETFSRLTSAVDDGDRWQAAEELIAILEGVLMERDERGGA